MHGPQTVPGLERVSIEDKYVLEDGRIFLSGVQALVRVVLDQLRADRAAGLDTGAFISGYQGSPLGTLDKELQRCKPARELGAVLVPGLNEELGATAVMGSQLAPQLPGARREGVTGYWYGKAPGLDRAADAIRHANYIGTHPKGGVVALVGDDPACKSSTLPSTMGPTMAALLMPTFVPGSVQEALDLGRHAVACSRASGLWSGLEINTAVADGTATAVVSPDRLVPELPVRDWRGQPYVHKPDAHVLAPVSLQLEETLFGVRLEIARAYAALNGLNAVRGDRSRGARLGLVTVGRAHYDTMQALEDLGLGDLEQAGIRVLKLDVVWPLDEGTIRDFARDLPEIVVVEDKIPFVETAVRDALYPLAERPPVLGKRDAEGRPLLPQTGELTASVLARALASRLGLAAAAPAVARKPTALPMSTTRTPFFCSGCPHNRSTVAPEGTVVGAGIGCHTMILLNPEGKGDIAGITQMGGEGAQFIGMAPFTDTKHFAQNLGDGTFHHSGSLAVRAAVAAGLNCTYKIFYNSAVAMTGGQDVEGVIAVDELTRWLQIEGVRRIIVTTEDLDRYDGVTLAPIAEVRDRKELDRAQHELAAEPGVTVLIHDQRCAAEKRRLRKRGKLEDPPERMVINERVCEGCGDCGKKSSCLSVQPVETEFGRKTRIHQASCNKDYTCLEGDCPSFLTVVPGKKAKPELRMPDTPAPEPRRREVASPFTMRIVGIGGTGVVTVSQVVGMAAHLEGRATKGLDATGLSQKGGPVVSDLRIASGEAELEGANRASAGGVDLLVGCDLLGSVRLDTMTAVSKERTVAVVATAIAPTGGMVTDPDAQAPMLDALLAQLDAGVAERTAAFDAIELSEVLFGDSMPANVMLLGAAYQSGALPLGADAIERAIELNGAGVKANLAAFAWGRAFAHDPSLVEQILRPVPEAPPLDAWSRKRVEAIGAEGALRELLEVRIPDLVAYQSRRWAQRYADAVGRVAAAERERTPGSTVVSEAFARALYKAMSYKDEYEVARLHLDPAEQERIRREFGPDAKVHYNLHPPALRALGMERKLKLRAGAMNPAFGLLRRGRRLRGTWLDPFGHAEVRRVERELVAEVEALGAEAAEALTPQNARAAAELLAAFDMVRGYEDIKLANVERWRARVAELRQGLRDAAEGAASRGGILPIVHHG
jgi:indolepyruvate ferredoxin oxidoreductase